MVNLIAHQKKRLIRKKVCFFKFHFQSTVHGSLSQFQNSSTIQIKWSHHQSSTPHSHYWTPHHLSHFLLLCTTSHRFEFPKTANTISIFSLLMASNFHRNGAQRGSAKFDRPLKPRPRASSPSPGSAIRRPSSAARNDAG